MANKLEELFLQYRGRKPNAQEHKIYDSNLVAAEHDLINDDKNILGNGVKYGSLEDIISGEVANEDPFPFEEVKSEIDEVLTPYYDQLIFDAQGDYKTARVRLDEDLKLAQNRGEEDKISYLNRLSDNLDRNKDRLGEDYGVAKDRMQENRKFFLDEITKEQGYSNEDYWREVERQGTERNRFLQDIATQEGYLSNDYKTALGRSQQERADFLSDMALTRGWRSEDFDKAVELQQDEKARLLEDVATAKDYSSKDYELVMDRLSEEEGIFKARDQETFNKSTKAFGEQKKRQGILDSGVAAQEWQDIERQHQYMLDDYNRQLSNTRNDLETQYERQTAQLDLQEGRGLENIDKNIDSLQTQFDRAERLGNTEEARGLRARLDNLIDMKTQFERQSSGLERQEQRGTQDYDKALKDLAIAKERRDTASETEKAQYEIAYQRQLTDVESTFGRSKGDLERDADQTREDYLVDYKRQYGEEGDNLRTFGRLADDMQKAQDKLYKDIGQQKQVAGGEELLGQYETFQETGETYPYTTYKPSKTEIPDTGVPNYQDVINQYSGNQDQTSYNSSNKKKKIHQYNPAY